MSETPALPQMPWLDLWQYSSELPLVMAGPMGPLMACAFSPMDWGKLMSTYALLPMAVADTLTNGNDSD
jgi:hypothetical protein